MDDTLGSLVRRCGRLQKAWIKVIHTYRNPNTKLPLPNLSVPHHQLRPKKIQSPRVLIDFAQSKRADDLIPEESNTVMLALKRLPPKEAYDRVFRLRRAFQVRTFYFSG